MEPKIIGRHILENLAYYGCIALAFISGVLLTLMFCVKKISIWKIRWIELEHDLARLQNRKPRGINEL